jgi:uncharacterized protein (DUF2384 family)
MSAVPINVTNLRCRKMIGKRWGISAPSLGAEGGAHWNTLLAISVSLGCLFDDNEEAERRWMQMPRNDLDGKSPLSVIVSDPPANADRVLGIVRHMCGWG